MGLVDRQVTEPFLKQTTGVIHVGANYGQERELYHSCGVRVLWIEPIPEVFKILRANIKNYPGQSAIQGLVTDQDDKEYQFHISNNDGMSSSILDLNRHKDIWPTVAYEKTIVLPSTTLATLLKRERIEPSRYDALVMDTQGSELLVLKGAVSILHNFKFIKTEVPDFESYTDCCQLHDIESFLNGLGYRELSRLKFAERPDGGSYYDIVYEKHDK
jgi:FkbM family methyltransferase